jgi:hypothetical protein
MNISTISSIVFDVDVCVHCTVYIYIYIYIYVSVNDALCTVYIYVCIIHCAGYIYMYNLMTRIGSTLFIDRNTRTLVLLEWYSPTPDTDSVTFSTIVVFWSECTSRDP